jgi:hypothetical protein
MAQVKLLKIGSTGLSTEFDSAADEITLASFTVQGGGPVLSSTGLDMNNQDIVDIQDLAFQSPSTATINFTAGSGTIDNLMLKERNNVMTTAGAVLFPLVTDSAGQLDSFKLPHIAGAPSATPSFSSDAGYLVYDSTNKSLYAWDGVAWDNLNTVSVASNIDDTYTADEDLLIRDVVYISAADSVSKADADDLTMSQAVGFATAAALDTASVTVRKFGRLSGFSGLTPGARYYLSTTAGEISSTIPAGTGNVIVQVGYAKSATVLDIAIQSLGRRA